MVLERDTAEPRELPRRTDLRTRRERILARVMLRGWDLIDRLAERALIDVTHPAEDPFYRDPENVRALAHGEVIAARPVEVRALRRVIKADAWQVDFNGPHHAFAAGHLAAHLVLDGIRAAIAFGAPGVTADAPVGLWGYSGGAQATLCAAERHSIYAPELNIVGVAAGGLTVDPCTTPRTFEDAYDGSILSGLPLGGIIGVSRENPEVDLDEGLNPQGRAVVASAADMRMFQLALTFPFLHWADYLSVPDVLDIPGLRAAFETHRYGLMRPTAPVCLYHGVLEQNLPISEADAFVDAYRAMGADVTYNRIRLGEHLLSSALGAPGALRFLAQRFASSGNVPHVT